MTAPFVASFFFAVLVGGQLKVITETMARLPSTVSPQDRGQDIPDPRTTAQRNTDALVEIWVPPVVLLARWACASER